MAKYRITSIPANLPQAQDGGSFWKKKYNVAKSKKLKRNKTNTSKRSAGNFSNEVGESISQDLPMVEVQGVDQPSYWNQMSSDVVQGIECPPGKENFEGNCLTEDEILSILDARTAEMKQKNFDRRVEQGFKKSNVFADSEYASKMLGRYISARNQQEQDYDNYANKYYDTFKKSKKSDKIQPFKKFSAEELDQLQDVVDQEGNVVIDETTGQPLQQAKIDAFKNNFLINKTKDGFYELYPKDIVRDRILQSGFNEEQFKNFWGLDPEQVKEQVGDMIGTANEIYNQRLQQRIIKTAIDKNISVEDAIKTIPKSEGTQTGLTNRFKKSTQKIIDDTFDIYTNSMLESMLYDPDVAKKDEDVFYSEDPKTAWENKYHAGDLKYISDKQRKGQKAYDEAIKNFSNIGSSGASDEYYQNQGRYDDRMAQQRLKNQGVQKAINLSRAESARQGAQDKKFNDAFGQYLSNQGTSYQKELLGKAFDKLRADPKAKINFLRDIEKYPDLVMGDVFNLTDDESGKTYSDLYSERLNDSYMNSLKARQNTFKEGSYKPELTTGNKIFDYLRHPFHAAYYAMHPTQDMHGNWNIDYDTRLKLEKEKGINLGTMDKVQGFNPMSVLNLTPLQALNPFKIGSNLRQGYDKGNFIGALGDEIVDIGTSVGAAKGFNALSGSGLGLTKGAGTLVSSIFNPFSDIGYALKAGKNLDNATDYIKKGDYKNAAWEGLEGGLNAIPLIGLPKYLKGFNRFNDATSGFNFNRTFNNANQLNFNSPNLLGTQQIPKYNILNKDGQLIRNQYKNGGSLPKAQLGKIVSSLKLLEPVEVYGKQFLRSHYNPLSYPVKLAGSKVAGLSSGAFRQPGEIAKALLAKEGDLTYKGQNTVIVRPGSEIEKIYTEGGRDLVKNYMLGQTKGLQELMYDFEKDPGLNQAIDYYGPLKAYELYSKIPHGENLGIQDFMKQASGFSFNKDKVIDDLMSGFDQNLNIFDQSKNTRLLFDLKRDLGEEAGNAKYSEIAKDNLKYLFDQYGNDVIPFQANVDPMHTKDLILRGNPIMPLDDIGGHMGFLKKGPDGNYDFTTRDLWSFRPSAYGKRYAGDSTAKALFKDAQVQLMDTFGKPFILHQTNPIKFKEGGDLPKAKMGWPPGGFRSLRKIPTVFGREVYRPSSTIFNTGIKTGNIHVPKKIDFLKETGPEIDERVRRNLIWDFDEYTGGDPANLPGISSYIGRGLASPTELTKYLGDFDFKPFSDGWQVRNQMMNAFDGPQWAAGKNDFFTESELINLVNQQSEWQKARNSFDDMYPENPAMGIMNAFSGDNSREELFSNLYPNASMPNFRSKFTTPEQEALLQQNLPWQYSVRDKGMLNSWKLNPFLADTLNDKILPSFKRLTNFKKDLADDNHMVGEYRGMLGVKYEDWKNASPEQISKWAKEINKKLYNRDFNRYKSDIEKPFKGSDAWNQITSQPGWKNKNGGVAMKLTKKEIDKYVQGGYIVEEE
jgi:hypothetical protein